MPTARELLEQADALMRRNRAAVDDDIPVLTDAVPSVPGVQSRFAPVSRPMPDAPRPAVAGNDNDVPVLTDAVEEIEAAALVPAVGEGEPSDWLDMEDGETSVIGDAPDSITMVPPVKPRQPEPAPVIDEFDGLDDELAAAIAASPREEEPLQPPPAALSPSEPLSAPVAEVPAIAPAVFAGGAAALLHETVITRSEFAAPALSDVRASPPLPAAPEAAGMADVPVAPEVTEVFDLRGVPEPPAVQEVTESFDGPQTTEPPAVKEVTKSFDGPQATEAPKVIEAFDVPHPSEPPEVIVAPDAPPAPEVIAAPDVPHAPDVHKAPVPLDDAAHWEAIAEEVRMQVLQRIDLFTDTGLRAQLGERLQPIVDRASADLVATINLHVGELLRAYVAEAIEREIDSWRRNH